MLGNVILTNNNLANIGLSESRGFSISVSIPPAAETRLAIPDSETSLIKTIGNELIIKKAGIYLVVVKFSIKPGNNDGLASIYRNNTSLEGLAFKNTTQSYASWNKFILTKTVLLNSNDKLDLRISHNAASNLDSQWSIIEFTLIK